MSTLSNWSSSSISNLFNSGSTGNNAYSGLSSLLSDYGSIRNGSYGKLMKSYYSDVVNSDSSSKSSNSSESIADKLIKEKMYPSVSKDVSEANASLSQGISDMKSSVSRLQNSSTYEDTEGGSTARTKVTGALKDFVANYNTSLTASKNSTATGMTSNVTAIKNSTDANKDALAQIGITTNYDGTLSLDENTLNNVDLSKVKDLFSSDDVMSYGSKVASRLQYASYYTSTGSNSVTSTDSTSTRQDTISSALSLKSAAQSLASDTLYDKVKDEDGNETDQYDVDNITAKAKSFVQSYNEMFAAASGSTNSGVTSNLGYIKNTTTRYTDALSQIGITVGTDGKLSINEDMFKNSDMSKVKDLFSNYGSSVASNASLVNYYMGTQASSASGYTASASYHVTDASTYTAAT